MHLHSPIRFLVTLAILLAIAGCRDDREITEAEGEMAVVVTGNNQFAVDLYSVNAAEEGNLFFSPFSINTALSMLQAGAEGDTEDQITAALGVGDEAAWHDNLAALSNDLCGDHHRSYALLSANGVWGQDGVPFDPGFETLMEDTYEAPIQTMDFATNSSSATDEINGWVEDNTEGHIEDLFSPGDIDSTTKLVLANAIYFKADWAEQFDEGDTRDREFNLRSGDTVQTLTMSQTDDFGYTEDESVQVLEMAYEDDELSMVVILPKELDGIADIESSLTADQLTTWTDGLRTQEVAVTLPRFEMKTELRLMENLGALGITDAFDGNLADFTGFTDPGNAAADWFVQAARHKAYVKVDEQGTEAAAATGFSVGVTSVPQIVEFHADHPFIFLIRDMLTDTVLFMGRLEIPEA